MTIQIYYIENANSIKYNKALDAAGIRTGLINSSNDLKTEIENIPKFCRNEDSILTSDLLTYIKYDVVLYAFDLDNNMLKGVLTFNVNEPKINLRGICVPGASEGTGSKLIRALIAVAKNIPGAAFIQLDCYSEGAANFYQKNGFIIINRITMRSNDSDSDSDNDSDASIRTKYVMKYDIISASGGRKKTRRNKTNRRKTMKKRKMNYRKTKCRKTKSM